MTPPANKDPSRQPEKNLTFDSEKDTMLNSENSLMKIKQKSAGKKKSRRPARKRSAKRTKKKQTKPTEQDLKHDEDAPESCDAEEPNPIPLSSMNDKLYPDYATFKSIQNSNLLGPDQLAPFNYSQAGMTQPYALNSFVFQSNVPGLSHSFLNLSNISGTSLKYTKNELTKVLTDDKLQGNIDLEQQHSSLLSSC